MRLEDGTIFDDYAEVFLNGGGRLNHLKRHQVEGLHDFKGTTVYSAQWDESLDLTYKYVLTIDAGSSAVQIAPTIVERVKSLDIVIRSRTRIAAGFGFASKYAGKNGDHFAHSEETKRRFWEDPMFYLAYCEAIESELSTRFQMLVNDSAS